MEWEAYQDFQKKATKRIRIFKKSHKAYQDFQKKATKRIKIFKNNSQTQSDSLSLHLLCHESRSVVIFGLIR